MQRASEHCTTTFLSIFNWTLRLLQLVHCSCTTLRPVAALVARQHKSNIIHCCCSSSLPPLQHVFTSPHYSLHKPINTSLWLQNFAEPMWGCQTYKVSYISHNICMTFCTISLPPRGGEVWDQCNTQCCNFKMHDIVASYAALPRLSYIPTGVYTLQSHVVPPCTQTLWKWKLLTITV